MKRDPEDFSQLEVEQWLREFCGLSFENACRLHFPKPDYTVRRARFWWSSTFEAWCLAWLEAKNEVVAAEATRIAARDIELRDGHEPLASRCPRGAICSPPRPAKHSGKGMAAARPANALTARVQEVHSSRGARTTESAVDIRPSATVSHRIDSRGCVPPQRSTSMPPSPGAPR